MSANVPLGGVRETNYRFVVALLLFVAGLINYMDRAALGIAAPFLKEDLELTPSELGLVFSTFFVGYGVFSFLGGQLADRYGPRRVYSWAVASWSILCALTGTITSFGQLFWVRSLFGVAEGPMASTTNRTIKNWFPPGETGRAIGFTFSGQTLGSAIAAPIVGSVALAYGWRIAFFAIGAVGLVWIVFWRRWVTDRPRENPRVSAAEIRRVEVNRPISDAAVDHQSPALRAYLLRASVLSVGLGMFAGNYALYIFLSWLPSYLIAALHFSVQQMSYVAAIPWACGFVGYIGGGALADLVYRRSSDRLRARKLATSIPLALAALALIAIDRAPNAFTAVTSIALAVMLLTSSMQSCWATVHELVPESRVGSVGGFVHLLSNVSGVIGPTATGFAVQYLGGYGGVFVVAATIATGGAAAMVLFVKRELPQSPIGVNATR